MTKFEKLVKEIMEEASADGEPVTKEEAEEMAKMELGAKEERRYEKSDKPRKPSSKERKVDEEKKALLECVLAGLRTSPETDGFEIKTETEIKFTAYGNNYTVKLTKHRPPKKQAVYFIAFNSGGAKSRVISPIFHHTTPQPICQAKKSKKK